MGLDFISPFSIKYSLLLIISFSYTKIFFKDPTGPPPQGVRSPTPGWLVYTSAGEGKSLRAETLQGFLL